MKNSILLAVFALCMPLSFNTAQAAHPATNPSSPEAITLGLINDAAGDSWAEGGDVDHLSFTHLVCDLAAAQCELTYTLKLYRKPAVAHGCKLTGIAGYNDLLEIVKFGFVLKDGVTAQIDACMTAAGA